MTQILTTAGSLIDRIKINAVSRECRDGRILWIKRRRWTARPVMACANHFFRIVGNPIQALDEVADWQRWEVDCFRRLHGDCYHAFAEGARAVAAEEIPGQSLSHHLNAGTLAPEMLAAAGRELRRAHAARCETYGGWWSHGDPHLGNFIYDPDGERARLIDFEVRHNPAIGADERHADDLLILLQDMLGRIAPQQWLPNAHAFLEGYDRPEIVNLLRKKLIMPRGLPRVWWAVRTTYLRSSELERRIRSLRENI